MDDQCLGQNQDLDRILKEKGIPHQLFLWEAQNAENREQGIEKREQNILCRTQRLLEETGS